MRCCGRNRLKCCRLTRASHGRCSKHRRPLCRPSSRRRLSRRPLFRCRRPACASRHRLTRTSRRRLARAMGPRPTCSPQSRGHIRARRFRQLIFALQLRRQSLRFHRFLPLSPTSYRASLEGCDSSCEVKVPGRPVRPACSRRCAGGRALCSCEPRERRPRSQSKEAMPSKAAALLRA